MTELNEGLATYVQLRAAGRTTVELPEAEFPAADVRERTYVIGPALAFLLDRLRPGWQAVLEAGDDQHLDRLLGPAVGADGPETPAPCALASDEIDAIERTAREEARAVIEARTERRRLFDERTGWRLVVEVAAGRPLWLQGFDPLNVERVEEGLLHTRLLELGNEAGELRVLDEAGGGVEALTEGVGPHPLFNGVGRLTVAGLAEPQVETPGRVVSVSAPGFTARFEDASVEIQGTQLRLRLGSGE